MSAWKILEFTDQHNAIDGADPSEHIVIADQTDAVAKIPLRHPNAKAIANLIAAAPDLFTNCQLLNALEENETHDYDTRWKQARQGIRDILEKITGAK
ncbi:MAG: hypothetical protein EBZ69_00330 [Alphaproteobacteria bacterium]|nr:hypothetical protein [Alphaproteobacteria bacterium]